MTRLLVLIAALWVSAAGAAYKCVDAKGITHVGDTPPPGCAAVMMYEVTPTGKVLREIEPTLTPEQAKVRAAELERKKAADAAAAEQKRKDLALLSTYASEKEFEVARDRNIEPIKGRIASAQDRIKAVDKREKEIKEEMEFYKAGKSKKGGEMPSNLTTDLKRLQAERETLVAGISAHEKEMEEIRVKYEADRKRWVELKSGAGGKSAQGTAPALTPAGETKTVKKN